MTGGGTVSNPLLDFQLQPIGARRNWRNVLNKQPFEATLQQHDGMPMKTMISGSKSPMPFDAPLNVRLPVMTPSHLIPHISPCNPTPSRTLFNPPLSPCVNSKRGANVWTRSSKLSRSIQMKSSLPTIRSRWRPPSFAPLDPEAVTVNDTNHPMRPSTVSPKSPLSPSKTTTSCVALELS